MANEVSRTIVCHLIFWIHTNHLPPKPYFFADLHCFHISDSINGSLLNTSRQEN
ncbi:hypothetical protein DEO72_LG2g2658 [Vigna unguiculata]|uniref:Uncharacterized protein n=1 Tax=Vigna unguiculata TaxID=3917 RepID=A0A4D6L1F1_VIGUN|nr:hypothetical protein DEO72_LG2g2658 [Vigna unguiculata]